VRFQRLSAQLTDIFDPKYSELLPKEHKHRIAECLLTLANQNNNSYVDDERVQMRQWAKKLQTSE
jgi:hypothetical protein